MKICLENLVKILAFICFISFLISFCFIFLITNGIRINNKCNVSQDGLQLVQYEQVYHVFITQEVFLTVKNSSEEMIGTLKIREKNTKKEVTIHKLRPDDKIKMYFSLDSYFSNVEFEIVEVRFVEMY